MNLQWICTLLGYLQYRKHYLELRKKMGADFKGSIAEVFLKGIERDLDAMLDEIDISELLEMLKK